jgi:hypothetical protein
MLEYPQRARIPGDRPNRTSDQQDRPVSRLRGQRRGCRSSTGCRHTVARRRLCGRRTASVLLWRHGSACRRDGRRRRRRAARPPRLGTERCQPTGIGHARLSRGAQTRAARGRGRRSPDATLQQPAVQEASQLLSSNIGCRLHLASGIREQGLKLPTQHPLTLLSQQLDHAG